MPITSIMRSPQRFIILWILIGNWRKEFLFDQVDKRPNWAMIPLLVTIIALLSRSISEMLRLKKTAVFDSLQKSERVLACKKKMLISIRIYFYCIVKLSTLKFVILFCEIVNFVNRSNKELWSVTWTFAFDWISRKRFSC